MNVVRRRKRRRRLHAVAGERDQGRKHRRGQGPGRVTEPIVPAETRQGYGCVRGGVVARTRRRHNRARIAGNPPAWRSHKRRASAGERPADGDRHRRIVGEGARLHVRLRDRHGAVNVVRRRKRRRRLHAVAADRDRAYCSRQTANCNHRR